MLQPVDRGPAPRRSMSPWAPQVIRGRRDCDSWGPRNQFRRQYLWDGDRLDRFGGRRRTRGHPARAVRREPAVRHFYRRCRGASPTFVRFSGCAVTRTTRPGMGSARRRRRGTVRARLRWWRRPVRIGMRDGGQRRHRGADAQCDSEGPHATDIARVTRTGTLVGIGDIGNGHGCSTHHRR